MGYFYLITVLLAIVFFPFYYQDLPNYATSYTEWSLESRLDRMDDNSSGVREIIFETTPTILILCSSVSLFINQKVNFILRGFCILIIFDVCLYSIFIWSKVFCDASDNNICGLYKFIEYENLDS